MRSKVHDQSVIYSREIFISICGVSKVVKFVVSRGNYRLVLNHLKRSLTDKLTFRFSTAKYKRPIISRIQFWFPRLFQSLSYFIKISWNINPQVWLTILQGWSATLSSLKFVLIIFIWKCDFGLFLSERPYITGIEKLAFMIGH